MCVQLFNFGCPLAQLSIAFTHLHCALALTWSLYLLQAHDLSAQANRANIMLFRIAAKENFDRSSSAMLPSVEACTQIEGCAWACPMCPMFHMGQEKWQQVFINLFRASVWPQDLPGQNLVRFLGSNSVNSGYDSYDPPFKRVGPLLEP
jgi:hypothetical protein